PALRYPVARAAGDALEHRRHGAHRARRSRSAAAAGTPGRRVSRRCTAEHWSDAAAVHGARSVSRRAYPAGSDRRRAWRGADALACRHVHGAADHYPEPEQSRSAGEPERSAAERAASPRKLNASSGDPTRPQSAEPGAGRSPRSRGREPDPSDILQALTTAVVVLDGALAIVHMNPAAETLLGVSIRQAAGRALRDVIHPAGELETLCRRAL